MTLRAYHVGGIGVLRPIRPAGHDQPADAAVCEREGLQKAAGPRSCKPECRELIAHPQTGLYAAARARASALELGA